MILLNYWVLLEEQEVQEACSSTRTQYECLEIHLENLLRSGRGTWLGDLHILELMEEKE